MLDIVSPEFIYSITGSLYPLSSMSPLLLPTTEIDNSMEVTLSFHSLNVGFQKLVKRDVKQLLCHGFASS